MTDYKYILENIVIYVCTTAIVLGLYYMSHSFHCLWGLALLSCVNYTKKDKNKNCKDEKDRSSPLSAIGTTGIRNDPVFYTN